MSSKYSEVYNLACKLVENLLTSLYKEYESFCQKLGRPLKEPVQIKRIEICGNEKKSEEISSNNNEFKEKNPSEGSNSKENLNNSNDEISNASVSTQSDRESNTSPIKKNEPFVQFNDSYFKSPETNYSQLEKC